MGEIWDFLRSVSVHFCAPRQNVLKLILKSPRFVPFSANPTQLEAKSNPTFLSLSRLYCMGVDMKPLALHEPVQFPVPKGTPFISPMIEKQWDHTVSYRIPSPDVYRRKDMGYTRSLDFDQTKAEHKFLLGATFC